MVQQDAITGFWDVEGTDLNAPNCNGVGDDLKYLSDLRRQQILTGELLSNFRVEADGGNGARVELCGEPVATLKIPTYAAGNGLRPQMQLLRGYSDLRADRIPEIYRQMDDIISFFEAAHHMNLNRREATLHVLSAVHSVVISLSMQAKHHTWMPRPSEYAAQVQPIIPTPDHSSYPSGHATEAFALATVLHRLMTGQKLGQAMTEPDLPMVFRIAHRIAVNRTVAGVHFPVDSAAGACLGAALGEAICDMAAAGHGTALTPGALEFEPDAAATSDFAPERDFDLVWIKASLHPTPASDEVENPRIKLFAALWADAVDEWA